jgi:hypothetical protein
MNLTEIDLCRGTENDHPEILVGLKYLCLIGGTYWAGTFNRINRGLIFNGWHDNVILYDRPGVNNSQWNKVFLIEESASEREYRCSIKEQSPKWTPRRIKLVRDSSGKIVLRCKLKDEK